MRKVALLSKISRDHYSSMISDQASVRLGFIVSQSLWQKKRRKVCEIKLWFTTLSYAYFPIVII